jgi:hypothetical protein
LLPILAGIAFVGFALIIWLRPASARPRRWMVPATLSLGFLLFSLHTVKTEGPLGFWTEHTRNRWGNQIWFDLLLGVGVSWFLIVPQAKAVKMRLPWWLALIVLTGGVGLLAMLARLLYLRDTASRGEPSA